LALGLVGGDEEEEQEEDSTESTTAAAAEVDDSASTSPEGDETETTGTRVRDLVLAELAALGGTGELASVLRARVERKLGRSLHQKTIGMTLYRLSKENLTRRNGRMWFLVPPSAETRDPGVAAPGPEEGQNGKEDA
jgi:hypothetical protein